MFYPDSIKLHGPQEEMSTLFRHFQGALLQCESLLKSLKPFAITELENRLLTGNSCLESENDPAQSPIAGMLFFDLFNLIVSSYLILGAKIPDRAIILIGEEATDTIPCVFTPEGQRLQEPGSLNDEYQMEVLSSEATSVLFRFL